MLTLVPRLMTVSSLACLATLRPAESFPLSKLHLSLFFVLILGAEGCEPPSTAQKGPPPASDDSKSPEFALPPTIKPAPMPTTIFSPKTVQSPVGSAPNKVARSLRKWITRDGSLAIEADLIDVIDGEVILRDALDRSIKLPLTSFLDVDIAYIRQRFPVASIPTTITAESNPSVASSIDIPVKLVSPVQKVRTESPKDILLKLERAAQASLSAKDAVAIYEAHGAAVPLPPELILQRDTNLSQWRGLAERQSIRMGQKWSDIDAANLAQSSAHELILGALRKLASDDPKVRESARADLKAASISDPMSGTANLLTGLIFATIPRDYEQARLQFLEALQRDPSNIAALNNLGLVEMRLKNYLSAMARWERAAEISPTCGEIAHNVRRFLSEVDAHVIGVQPQDLVAFRALAKTLEAVSETDPFSAAGWLYLPPLGLAASPAAPARLPKSAQTVAFSRQVVVGTANGFVIAPGILISMLKNAPLNTHVVLIDPANTLGPGIEGVVFAHDESSGLSLIRSQSMQKLPIPLCLEFPRTGTNVGFLGYAQPEAIGQTLAAGRGALLHAPAKDSNLLFVATTSVRLGDGACPMLDSSGRLIGISTANRDIGGATAFGITSQRLLPFLSKNIPDFNAASADTAQASWEDIDKRIAQSMMLVSIPHELQNHLVEHIPAEKGNALEDRFCNVCRGLHHIDCPVRGCANGGVLVNVREITGIIPGTNTATFLDRATRVPCKHCEGKGRVECPGCENGIDTKLR